MAPWLAYFQGVSTAAKNSDMAPIALAAQEGKLEVVQDLAARGANIETQDVLQFAYLLLNLSINW